MTAVRKNLGQIMSTAGADADLYTVPAATDAVVSSIVVCNQGVATTFSVRHRKAGAGATAAQLLVYGAPIAVNTTVTLALGATLAATDVISVQAATATVSFNAYGQENS